MQHGRAGACDGPFSDWAPPIVQRNTLNVLPTRSQVRLEGENLMKRAKKKVAKKAAKPAAKKAVKAKAIKKTAKKAAAVKKPAVNKGSGRANADGTVNWNFKLLSHHMLDGFGGMGEGMSLQIAPDGRRVMWLAHESAPKNFTAVDVSDPRKPKVICQTDLPASHMRSNSLETCGNIMAVAYQTQKKNLKPAGMELFDISNPEKPRSIG